MGSNALASSSSLRAAASRSANGRGWTNSCGLHMRGVDVLHRASDVDLGAAEAQGSTIRQLCRHAASCVGVFPSSKGAFLADWQHSRLRQASDQRVLNAEADGPKLPARRSSYTSPQGRVGGGPLTLISRAKWVLTSIAMLASDPDPP